MIEGLFAVTRGFINRFPGGNHPFKICTRLLEEGGELAQQVNHFEGEGVKMRKMGAPNRTALAKEIAGVLHCAANVAVYYGVEQEVEAVLAEMYRRLKAEGNIVEEALPVPPRSEL